MNQPTSAATEKTGTNFSFANIVLLSVAALLLSTFLLYLLAICCGCRQIPQPIESPIELVKNPQNPQINCELTSYRYNQPDNIVTSSEAQAICAAENFSQNKDTESKSFAF